ncbi:sodium:solute symporter [Gimesia fumaroli]|uniref:Sodium/glucose cotransporter n=1 Tax=Gimesia fumaroli TaxID=2527976 RepID=A0A518I9J3_9PLAN|nr:sodium:solute symporter [Gimesia fumaroli]QDV49729.1 Sodium/glucose cotransporter [Gimesia fumaroli]
MNGPFLLAATQLNISLLDSAIILAYLILITGMGLYVSRKQKQTVDSYFLAGRSLKWPTIGLSLFATNISTVHLIGLAADGYRVGLVVGNFECLAAFTLIILGLVFAPIYHRSGVVTLPDFLEQRFSAGSRIVLAIMGVVAALFIHIGMTLYAGSTIMHEFFGIDVFTSVIVISAITTLYTVMGGLKAVVITESIQTVLLIIGSFAITWFAAGALNEQGIDSFTKLRAALPEKHMSMLHESGGFSWFAFVLGYPVLGIWYWCADQTIVQRVLGGETEKDAQVGPLFAGFIKVLPLLIMVFPGVLAYVLFRDQIGDNPNSALPVLISQLIPEGLKGMIAAGLLAALMSTIAGALNSTATLISIDVVKKLKPETSDARLVVVGRITAVVVMILAIGWSTMGSKFESIFSGLNSMIACLAPPITVVFIWGVLWKRGTAKASLITLIVGSILGGLTFVLDFGFGIITNDLGIPFMLQAWWLFVICSVVFVVISLLTPPPTADQIEMMCWKHPLKEIVFRKLSGVTDPRLIALLLAGIMSSIYITFA